MKKCITGVGLLLASLILFGCQKTVTETTVDKFPEVRTVTLPRSADAGLFDSGFTKGSDDKMSLYAVRVAELKKGVAVNTVFNDAYLIKSGINNSKLDADTLKLLKEGLGFDGAATAYFVPGDDIIVGYRLIDKNGLITNSKVVKYHFVDYKNVYLPASEKVTVTLHYSVFDETWYARAQIAGKAYQHMTAKLTFFNNNKNQKVDETVDAVSKINGNTTFFVWKLSDVSKLTDKVLRPSVEFTDLVLGLNKVKSINDDSLTLSTIIHSDKTNAWNLAFANTGTALRSGKTPVVSLADANEIRLYNTFDFYGSLFNTDEASTWTTVKGYVVKNGTTNPPLATLTKMAGTSLIPEHYQLTLSSPEAEKDYTVKIVVEYGMKSKNGVYALNPATKEMTFSFKTGRN